MPYRLPPVKSLTTPELVDVLKTANARYRFGWPIMSDETYDLVYLQELRRRNPDHVYLHTVEPEPQFSVPATVRHSRPMKSILSVREQEEVWLYTGLVERHAALVGVSVENIRFHLKPKLDGVAVRLENGVLATRGDGLLGNDITHLFGWGVVATNPSGSGDGELVITSQYFQERLSQQFDTPRTFVTQLFEMECTDSRVLEALTEFEIQLVMYSELPPVELTLVELETYSEDEFDQIANSTPFATDGVVIEVVDIATRQSIGDYGSKTPWMLAKKPR